jgi:tRNA nucleotidyltransferase (CCA-adding enzyme)
MIDMPLAVAAEHFAHDADIGVRGLGHTREQAFEQAALALTEVVTDPSTVKPEHMIEIECAAPTDSLLLVDWLNRLIYEMAVRHMLFARFAVTLEGRSLRAQAWGERLDRTRHAPAVEPKGATLTALEVEQRSDGVWIAQCVIDV